MNIFRVPFLMERLVPDSLTGSLDSTYLKDLKTVSERTTVYGYTPVYMLMQSFI